MDYYLFRKLKIENKNYYQLYKIEKDFTPTDEFTTFDKRNDKDYFYVKGNEIAINDDYLYFIFEDKNGTFTNIEDIHLLSEIYDKFKEKYSDLKNTELKIVELKPIDELVNIVESKIKFQKYNVKELVRQIYRNQQILGSNLNVESKKIQKNNILFFGPRGNGKKTITRILENNLDIPSISIDVPLNFNGDGISLPTINDFKIEIAKRLMVTCDNDKEINNSVVFIHEDIKEKEKILKTFANINDLSITTFKTSYLESDLSNNITEAYINFIGQVTDSEPFKYRGNIFDFRTITFVVVLDRNYFGDDVYEILSVLNKANCDYLVPINELTDENKIELLLGKDGIFNQYKNYLNKFDKKLMISTSALTYLIERCNEIDSSIAFLNKAIEYIIKNLTSDSIKDVIIKLKNVEDFCNMHLNMDDESKESSVVQEELMPLFNILKEKIVGQDKGLKNILYNIIENRRMANKDNLEDPKQYIKNILVRGESGGGKTFIINNIAKLLNIPCFIADATQYTEAGYVGADVTDMLVELYHNANDDLESAQKGILVIDEIDKKSGENGRTSDVSRGAVLNSLLKIIEGAEISINVRSRYDEEIVNFDTSKLTIILSGAFEGIEEIRDERIKKLLGTSKVGFSNEKEKKLTIDKEIIDKDYVNFGMSRQFMARIPVIVNLEKNTKESLKNIMINSSASALKIESIRLNERGISLEYTDEFYDALAEEALKLNIGVRGIDKVLQKVLTDINIQDIESSKIEKIILDKDVIEDANKVILIPKNNEKVKVMKKS